MSSRDRIEAVLEGIRPALHADGGDVELIDFDEDEGLVQVRLTGACGSCPISMMTLRHGIERRLVTNVPGVKAVQAL